MTTEKAEGEGGIQLINRVASYPLVQYASGTVKGYYNYAKESSSYVKASLEVAEHYSQAVIGKAGEYSKQPTIDAWLHKADEYGCKQLDKIENGSKSIKQTYEDIKPKTYDKLDAIATKIHGTAIELALLKTVSLVDTVVDSLFPPSPSEPEEISQVPPEPNLVSRTAPVVNKLRERVSVQSIKHLPARSYEISKGFFVRAEGIPQVNYIIEVLTNSANKIKQASDASTAAAKNGLQKGTTLSRESAEHLYKSLQRVVSLVGNTVQLVTHLDAVEAKASVDELVALVQASRENLKENLAQHLDANALRADIATILSKAGELLTAQVNAAHAKAQQYDNPAIRKSVESIETVVKNILERFNQSQVQPQAQAE